MPSSDEYFPVRLARRISKKKRKRTTNPAALRPRVLLGNEPWSCEFCQECREWAASNPTPVTKGQPS